MPPLTGLDSLSVRMAAQYSWTRLVRCRPLCRPSSYESRKTAPSTESVLMRNADTDTRVLAATNRNLEKEVDEGRFREDLFYRLNVMEIYLPPLRDRREDIVPLATQFAVEFGQEQPRFSPGATICIETYSWPGNVRELRNVIERATLLARGDVMLPQHLPRKLQIDIGHGTSRCNDPTTSNRMVDIERTAILQALHQHEYSRTETARALGISRRALTYKLRDYREKGLCN